MSIKLPANKQVNHKGVWWMPWDVEAMKDVA